MRDGNQYSGDRSRAETVSTQLQEAHEKIRSTILGDEDGAFDSLSDVQITLMGKFQWGNRSKEEERHPFEVRMEVPIAQHRGRTSGGDQMVGHEGTLDIIVKATLVSNPSSGDTRIEYEEATEVESPKRGRDDIVVESGSVDNGIVIKNK